MSFPREIREILRKGGKKEQKKKKNWFGRVGNEFGCDLITKRNIHFGIFCLITKCIDSCKTVSFRYRGEGFLSTINNVVLFTFEKGGRNKSIRTENFLTFIILFTFIKALKLGRKRSSRDQVNIGNMSLSLNRPPAPTPSLKLTDVYTISVRM